MYVQDEDKIYDIEMQTHHYDDLGLRSRYYQSIIDADNLLRGQEYKNMKECLVIFICKDDPFKQCLPQYTFSNICHENAETPLGDKSTKIIFNAAAWQNEQNQNLKDFLRYVNTNSINDNFTNSLYNKIENIKKTDIFKTEYLRMYPRDFDLMEDGRQEGIHDSSLKNAVIAVKEFNIPVEVVAEKFNVDLNELKQKLDE